MPEAARWIGEVLPITHFIRLTRGIMLRDAELMELYPELIALGISIGVQCDGCIASHARGAARKGATAEQVAEVVGVAILMGGGPATVYGPRAWAAFKEFSQS